MNNEFPVAYQPGTLVEIPGIQEKGIVVRHSLTRLAGPGTFYEITMIDGLYEGETRMFSGDSPVAVEYTVEQKPVVGELLPHETVEQRRALGDIRVTLDGKPARITGFRMPFAQVQGGGESVEFAWRTVVRVVQSGGNFKSAPGASKRGGSDGQK
jgi:hypothetical protein